MKKIILLSILSVFFLFSKAQFSIGLQGALINGNALRGEYGNKTKGTNQGDYVGTALIFSNFGVVLNWAKESSLKNLPKFYWTIQTECSYKMQGNSNFKNWEDYLRVSYIEMPLLFGLKTIQLPLSKDESMYFFIHAGPSLKIKLFANYTYKFYDSIPITSINNITTYTYNTIEQEFDVSNLFKPVVLTANLGYGGGLNLWNHQLTIIGEMRLGYDLTDAIYSTDEVELPTKHKWYFKNNYFTHVVFLVGVKYNF